VTVIGFVYLRNLLCCRTEETRILTQQDAGTKWYTNDGFLKDIEVIAGVLIEEISRNLPTRTLISHENRRPEVSSKTTRLTHDNGHISRNMCCVAF
jgi:hypothetical protein